MKSGFAVLADTQFLPGYCILLAYPKAKSLNHLDPVARLLFLREMSLVGDAILEVCTPLRINYEILGNTDAYLHAHIIPRYDWEEDELLKMPVWMYPHEYRTSPEFEFNEAKHGELKWRLSEKLKELTT
jgi:diadenosine tetraphosphate (Ap4A) HIT family hydrolase